IGSGCACNLMRVLIRLTAPIYPYFYPYNLDCTLQFRHAPARLRVDANRFDLACGYAAVCLLRPLWFV
ncbi:hypothetical protein N9N45_06070, partial [Planktomarina temperata]|nr:hypothetical protein [Planktomarina temperata]